MGNLVGANWSNLFSRYCDHCDGVSAQGHEFDSIARARLVDHHNGSDVACLQPAPAAAPEGGGSFLVSGTSQDSGSAARESFRVAQGKYASVLGSRSPVVKRVDLADGKVKYRAMVGPPNL